MPWWHTNRSEFKCWLRALYHQFKVVRWRKGRWGLEDIPIQSSLADCTLPRSSYLPWHAGRWSIESSYLLSYQFCWANGHFATAQQIRTHLLIKWKPSSATWLVTTSFSALLYAGSSHIQATYKPWNAHKLDRSKIRLCKEWESCQTREKLKCGATESARYRLSFLNSGSD
jgi:hypothetical protein